MVFVFKASSLLLGASLALGQTWQHAQASTDALQQARYVAQVCPAVASAPEGSMSRGAFVSVEDAYLRTLVLDKVASMVSSKPVDGCRTA